MTKPHIVFLDRATIPPQIKLPQLQFEHDWIEYDYTSAEEVESRLVDADIVITNKVVLTAELLAKFPNIKMIAVSATGTNNLDIEYCQSAGIAVTNIQGYATRSVPEHVIAMLFALRRNLIGYHQDIQKGEWQRNKQFCFFTHPIGDVAGSTIGIIGSGALGQATATLATAIGMKVLFAERKGATTVRDGYLPFDTVLEQSDVLTLHCPLTAETKNLISSDEFAQMKSSAILINAGRGGLVDEKALITALKCGELSGAGVDVFTEEPAGDSNPLIANMDLPNLLLTPHVAWGSDSAIQRLADILGENIEAFVAGRMQNRVV
nr:D-2-hydroxyacid dehydrogenase [Vibrio maerlii]